MLPDRYLDRGVNAIARAFVKPEWTWDQFMEGHRGAGTLAGYYLVADGLAEPAAAGPIKSMLDREWADRPIFAPMADEAAAPQDLDRLLAQLADAFASGGHVGHNVIYPTFALRAFRRRPDLITRTRIDGIGIMATCYAKDKPTGQTRPAPFAPVPFSAWVLESFVKISDIYRGFGNGVPGHLVTYGQAVVDLHDLGYADLARIAETGYRDFVANVMKGPSAQEREKQRENPKADSQPTTTMDPTLAPYWQDRPEGIMEKTFAHETKYAYALLKHCRQANDPALTQRAMVPLFGPRQKAA